MDRMAAKGAIHVRVQVQDFHKQQMYEGSRTEPESVYLHVVNTHLQSYYSLTDSKVRVAL